MIDTREGPFGAVAVSPGYTGVQQSMQWLGPRRAARRGPRAAGCGLGLPGELSY